MNLRQLKYLIGLEPEHQKKVLAEMLVRKVGFLRKALDSESKKKELKLLAEKIEKLNTKKPIPKIKGVSQFSILAGDLLELLEVEENIDDFVWKAEQSKKIIQELKNQVKNKIQKLV